MVTVRDMNRIRRINVYIESAFWTFDLYNFRPFVSDLQACMLENDTVMNFIPIPTPSPTSFHPHPHRAQGRQSQRHAYKILISYRPTAINRVNCSVILHCCQRLSSILLFAKFWEASAFRIVLIDDESVVFVVEQCIRLQQISPW